ncbi:hypothetical protein F4553_007399 [Allocatelliglobosispora scoriae]|uniref:Uncharacterized protein n=1 Tax=Allocatelliglobosispora scoriae TaxID=643052 RepID=A0A841C211_9ACTN|nr:hypothetical protein [Allocatelliglobosispora scoriae]MBB5873965.1 hypothetical protein [Allocatelliglobosispora scoriae]
MVEVRNEAAQDDALHRFFSTQVRPKERLAAVRKLATQLWHRGRDAVDGDDDGAATLLQWVEHLPIRDGAELRAHYGTDTEATAEALIRESASLAGWLWTAAAVVPAPPPIVHTVKVALHSLVEIRLIGELYSLYDDRGTHRDTAWLHTILHAWAVGHPVATGRVSVMSSRDIAVKLRHSYVELASDQSRLSRVIHRGRDGAELVRRLGRRFQRRLRLDPSAWPKPPAISAKEIVTAAAVDAVRKKVGLSAAAEAPGTPKEYLAEAWAQHDQARAAAGAGSAPSARLATALDAQERHLQSFSVQLKAPHIPQQRQGEPPAPTTAYAHILRADEAIDRLEAVGAQPKRLGDWPLPARNTLVYTVVSAILALPMSWLAAKTAGAADSPVVTLALLAASFCGVPAFAYGIGMIAIGKLFRPWLGGQVPRSPILGAFVSIVVPAVITAVVAALLHYL